MKMIIRNYRKLLNVLINVRSFVILDHVLLVRRLQTTFVTAEKQKKEVVAEGHLYARKYVVKCLIVVFIVALRLAMLEIATNVKR